jgi:Tfp pilus assembly protein PilF
MTGHSLLSLTRRRKRGRRTPARGRPRAAPVPRRRAGPRYTAVGEGPLLAEPAPRLRLDDAVALEASRLQMWEEVITMMAETRRNALLPVLLLLVPSLASAWTGRLIGKVVDADGHPIPGVTVTTTSPDVADFMDVATTDDRGLFKVDFVKINVTYHYRLEKAGYVTLLIDQHWTIEGAERHEFKMERGQMATPSGPPPASTSQPAIQAFNEGAHAFDARDYATAKAKFEEAVGHDPKLRQAWEALSRVLAEQKDYAKAVEAAEKAMALGSTNESVLRLRWEAYHHLGDEAKAKAARDDLERIGRLTEEAKKVYNEGVDLLKAGDAQGAYPKFQQALEADPNLQVAQLALATTALGLGHAADAAAAAETVLKADPKNAEALRVQYNAALKLGDEAKVVDALVALAAVDRDMALDGLFKLARAAYDHDETAKAKEQLGKVLEIDPNHAQAHYLLGLLLMREGSKAEAEKHLERFLQLAPNDPDAATAQKALKYLQGH